MRLRPCATTKPAMAGSLSARADKVPVRPASLEVLDNAGPPTPLSLYRLPFMAAFRRGTSLVSNVATRLQLDPPDAPVKIIDPLWRLRRNWTGPRLAFKGE